VLQATAYDTQWISAYMANTLTSPCRKRDRDAYTKEQVNYRPDDYDTVCNACYKSAPTYMCQDVLDSGHAVGSPHQEGDAGGSDEASDSPETVDSGGDDDAEREHSDAESNAGSNSGTNSGSDSENEDQQWQKWV
jgi:hypothetical protein